MTSDPLAQLNGWKGGLAHY